MTGSIVTSPSASTRAPGPGNGGASASRTGAGYQASSVRPEARSIVVSPWAAALGMGVNLAGAEREHPGRLDAGVGRPGGELVPGVAVDLEAVVAERVALERGLVRGAVDDDRQLLAAGVRRADRRVAAQVAKARGLVRGAEPEAPAVEQAVDRRDARLAPRGDRGEVEQLHAGEQGGQLGRRDPALVGEDGAQVRSGGGVAVVEQALQRGDVLGRLVHGYSAASSASSSALSSPRTTGTAQPVRSTWRSSPTSTSSSPPSSSTVTGEAPPRSTWATAAPVAPVPLDSVSPTPRSKMRARMRSSASGVNHETLVRSGNSSWRSM